MNKGNARFLVWMLLLMLAMFGMTYAADGQLKAVFYQGSTTTNETMCFSSTGKSSVIDDLKVVIKNPEDFSYGGLTPKPEEFTITLRNRSTLAEYQLKQYLDYTYFVENLPSTDASYDVIYSINSIVQTNLHIDTPVEIGVSKYSMSNTAFSQNNQRISEIGIGDTDVTLTGWFYQGSAAVTVPIERISIDGVNYVSNMNYLSGSGFSALLGQITSGGKYGIKLRVDGVPVATFSVASATFPALTIDPGIIYVDDDTTFIMSPMVYDYASYSSLSTLESSRYTVELQSISGAHILASSVRSTPIASTIQTASQAANSTYTRLVMYGHVLETEALRFTSTGTVRVIISSIDGGYTKTVDLRVERAKSTEGLIGTLPYQSYAGESELNLRFRTSNNRPITEYTATITPSDGDPIDVAESKTSGYFYSMKPVTFSRNGKGSVQVQVSAIDRDYEQHDWSEEFTYEAPSLEVSVDTIPLNEEEYLVVYLRDSAGRVINNATVTIDGTGSRTSSSNGEYIFNQKWTSPGYKRIQAIASDGTLLADFSRLLKVQAPEVLAIMPDTETLLAGANQTLTMRVIDENGKEITGARIKAYVDGSTTAVSSTWNSRDKVYQVKVQPEERVVLQAETSDGRKVSPEIELSAVMPEVKCNVSELTDLFMDQLEFTFFNPITGEAISGTVSLRAQNVQLVERNIKGNTTNSKTGTVVTMDLYKKILTGNTDPMVYVDFIYSGKTYKDVLELPVSEATTTVSPTTVKQGVQEKITLEIKGAGGNGLEGVGVELKGSTQSAQGTTNAEGKVSFNVKAGSNTTEYVFVITRTDAAVQSGNKATTYEQTVQVERDTTPPVIAISNLGGNNYADSETNSFTFNLELSDDVALDSLFVNAQKTELEGASVMRNETVTLREGDNTITFVLRDKAGLETKREVVVNYKLPAPPQNTQPIYLRIDSPYVTQGSATLPAPPVNPQLINGRTMLPFRYLVETVLGGTVNYVDSTRAITAYVNNRTVEMVVDDPNIYVDGQLYVLDQEPVVINGSTLVPVRAFDHVVSSLQWDANTFTAIVYP